jgi:hypothetical protein
MSREFKYGPLILINPPQKEIAGMQPDMAGGLADVCESLYGVETRRSLQCGVDFAVGHRRQSGKNNLRIMEKRIEG